MPPCPICLSAVLLAILAPNALAAQADPLAEQPVGGVNRPELQPPPESGLPLRELELGGVAIRLPFGAVDAADAPVHGYAIPGPIAAFRGVDGLWRGHGYLETIPALVGFVGREIDGGVELDYRFEQGLRYRVTIRPGPEGCLLLQERSDLGPRNRWVFDATYGWDAGCACVCSTGGRTAAFLTLPCHYDRPEVHLCQSALAAAATPEADVAMPPAGVALFAHDPAARDIAGFWIREPAQWVHGERMGFTLYQHRQRPGDLASRHFLGPETKSDGVPNPRAVQMMGTAAFEGHVTLEFALGVGQRRLGFTLLAKPAARAQLAAGFKQMMEQVR